MKFIWVGHRRPKQLHTTMWHQAKCVGSMRAVVHLHVTVIHFQRTNMAWVNAWLLRQHVACRSLFHLPVHLLAVAADRCALICIRTCRKTVWHVVKPVTLIPNLSRRCLLETSGLNVRCGFGMHLWLLRKGDWIGLCYTDLRLACRYRDWCCSTLHFPTIGPLIIIEHKKSKQTNFWLPRKEKASQAKNNIERQNNTVSTRRIFI